MGASLQVKEDGDVSFGEAVAQLFEHGCFPHPSLSVNDQDVVGVLARDAVLDPLENILATEEHALFGDWRACNVGIDNISVMVSLSKNKF